MTAKQVHTTFNKSAGNWRNVSSGATKPNKVFETKSEAKSAGRQQAINQKAEHVIHNEDGKIAQRNSYGNDPFPPRG